MALDDREGGGLMTQFFRALLGQSGGAAAVAGLVGQWQSDAGVTTSGSEVTAIADQSGHGNNLGKADATGPTLVSGAVNGLPAMKCTSTVTRLSHVITQLNGMNTYTLVLVRTPYNDTQTGAAIHMSLEDGVGPQLSLGQGDYGDYRLGGFWNSAFQNTPAVYRGNTVAELFDIILVTRNGATAKFYKNGALLSTISGSASNIPSPTVYLGGDRSGNSGRGLWAQGRLYDHVLSSTDIATVFTDLGTKYDIPIVTSSGTALSRAGWTASAWADGGGSFVPGSAIDSNIGTRYLSAANPSAGTAWFKIDLGSAQTVGGVQTDNNPGNGGNWAQPVAGDVQYSDDNSTWHTVASWTLGTPAATIQASWTPSSHRYWRMLAQGANSDGGWWSIGELYLYSDAAP